MGLFESYLVKNPEDRFSLDRAYLVPERMAQGVPESNEPRSGKTGLRGFRPGPTQTRLYNHGRWLEA